MRGPNQDSIRIGLSRSDGSPRRALHRTRTLDSAYNQEEQGGVASHPEERREYSRAGQTNRQDIARQKASGHLR